MEEETRRRFEIRQGRQRPITRRELDMMLQTASPAEVLLRICRGDDSLNRLLEDTNLDTALVLKVLRKSVTGTEGAQREAVSNVLQTFVQHHRFLQRLDRMLPRADPETLKTCLILMKMSLHRMPNHAARFLYLTFHNFPQPTLPQYRNAADLYALYNEVNDLITAPTRQAERLQEAERNLEMRQRDVDVEPELYRGLSIIPTEEDFDAEHDLQLRANKTVGKYNSVNDYLDIQFRLLRADLILPLRDSILEYQAQGAEDHKHEFKSIKVYSHVRIVSPVCHDKGLCFRLSFSITNKRINWRVSNRLKYGSLLCLSSDNFQTYRCAVVENREPKDLQKGLVDVQFIFQGAGANQNLQMGRHEVFMNLVGESRDVRYVMVESPSYFEAYKYVLQGLQNITEESFPFWQYVGLCRQVIDPPRYLQERGPGATMDLRPLIDTSFKLTDTDADNAQAVFSPESQQAAAVDVATSESWPNRNAFNLDVTQFMALQAALKEEFSLIQGPPGTGKTFIGLMVMKALLHNKRLWIGEDGQQTPILLVCYTNHALDQFLEGILDFFEGKLIRVGSRSKSERLENYNLRSLRHRARENRTVPLEVHLAKVEARNELKEKKADVHLEAAKLEMLEREIVSEDFLKEFMDPEHFDSLKNRECQSPDNHILQWLGINADVKKIEEEGMKRKREEKRKFEANNAQRGFAQAAIPMDRPEERAEGEREEEDEEIDDEDEEDIDIFEDATNEARRNYHLDINDDDEDDFEDNFDLFGEIMGGYNQAENVRRVNQKLDDVDKVVKVMRSSQIAFNISEFGEETIPPKLPKHEKTALKSLLSLKRHYRDKLLDYMQKTEKMEEDKVLEVTDVWKMKKKADRWRLYHYWVDTYCRQIRGAIRDKSQEYERLARRYQEILHQEDKKILENSTIIGMTTTGAARYQEVLREIGPKIVLVEEAAEVLEGHVITSLSAECQHVILIGDHKQLRPNPSVHKLKARYDIDISLFERLVTNNYPLHVLQYQHRMRPEISQLLKIPELYPDLRDHDSVHKYPHILRVGGDVRFIHHEEMEETDGESKTYINKHEAQFVMGLFLYLIQQGYKATKISILSPYAGQIHHIKQLFDQEAEALRKWKHEMKGIRVVSVDNYQGEENDIIILSLVRSNVDNAIGFLKANNRLCVALSRAKMGLYVIGDLHGLANSSTMFREILKRASQFGFLDNHLDLVCTKHRGRVTSVRMPRDFKKVPEGGCNMPCNVRLDCGHTCERICHTDDEDHKEIPCKQNCRALCNTCGQPCESNDHLCGNHTRCVRPREKVLPNCGHTQKVPCHMEANQFECQGQCDGKLPCGHNCPSVCGKRHQHTRDLCTVLVEAESQSCGHKFKAECRNLQGNPEDSCTEPCSVTLACGHICAGTCSQCSNGRLHVNCMEPCTKILICGHACEAECSNCPPCRRPCENACIHSKCPKLCGEPCAPCLENCNWSCRHKECIELCCQPCDRPACDAHCPQRLDCGHICAGLCGEKCPRLCSICPQDQEELKEINDGLLGYDDDPNTIYIELDCGHVIDVDCVDQWMNTSTVSDDGQQVIGLKGCPYCKTPVRKCNRYNKQIKRMLLDLENVKKKYIGEKQRVKELQDERDAITRRMLGGDRLEADTFLTRGPGVLSVTILQAQINQIQLFSELCSLARLAVEGQRRWPNRGATFRSMETELTQFKVWALKKRTLFSDQNNSDAKREHSRLKALIILHTLQMSIDTQGLTGTIPVNLMTRLGLSVRALSVPGPVAQGEIDKGLKLCDELKELVPTSQIGISAEEKLQIVKAMDLQRGAWYKCPKGHIYAIGECGQAMEEAKCPECNAVIGGANHALNTTNAWAPEMDNAEVPIWQNIAADRDLAERLQRENQGGFI